eukprot:scaffold12492_cov98-Isochrysis_galbana.AAC.3
MGGAVGGWGLSQDIWLRLALHVDAGEAATVCCVFRCSVGRTKHARRDQAPHASSCRCHNTHALRPIAIPARGGGRGGLLKCFKEKILELASICYVWTGVPRVAASV